MYHTNKCVVCQAKSQCRSAISLERAGSRRAAQQRSGAPDKEATVRFSWKLSPRSRTSAPRSSPMCESLTQVHHGALTKWPVPAAAAAIAASHVRPASVSRPHSWHFANPPSIGHRRRRAGRNQRGLSTAPRTMPVSANGMDRQDRRPWPTCLSRRLMGIRCCTPARGVTLVPRCLRHAHAT